MGSFTARIYLPIFKTLLKVLKTKPFDYELKFGCRENVGIYCKEQGYQKILIITDKAIQSFGIVDKVITGIESAGLQYVIYDDILPNPTITMAEKGRSLGLEHNVDCAVSIGGGSVLDCGKLICAGIAAPEKPIQELCKVLAPKAILPHFAVPTTAGTGAEISMGAIMSDDQTHIKRTASSPLFTYEHIFLDSETMINMPQNATAACGFDALSHAVETYLSTADNEEGHAASLESTRIIMKNLPLVYSDGTNIAARGQMAYAAMLAGIALNKQMAGYAHPFAHAIGAKYNLPHGNMIGVTLPAILKYEKDACVSKLARLARECQIGDAHDIDTILADKFIDAVTTLRDSIGLKSTVKELQEEDIPSLVKIMFKDAMNYPTPKFLNTKKATDIMKGFL